MEEQRKVTANELGDALRPGLAKLKAYFSEDESNERAEAKVDRFLKGVRSQAHTAAQENNELLMLLKYGKAADAGPDQMKPIFAAIAARYGASTPATPETPKVLETGESIGSKEKAHQTA